MTEKFNLIKEISNLKSEQELKEVISEIEEKTNQAIKLINEATALCDKYKIGYNFPINLEPRIYSKLKKSTKKTRELEESMDCYISEVIEEFGLAFDHNEDFGRGWQYWNTSSLTC